MWPGARLGAPHVEAVPSSRLRSRLYCFLQKMGDLIHRRVYPGIDLLGAAVPGMISSIASFAQRRIQGLRCVDSSRSLGSANRAAGPNLERARNQPSANWVSFENSTQLTALSIPFNSLDTNRSASSDGRPSPR